MEFFLVVLIFISCMIALALLIYYCQEYRNPKYSFTDNQRDISAIALAIGVPGFHPEFQPGEYRTAPHSPGFAPGYVPTAPEPGFVMGATSPPPYPITTNNLPAFPIKPPPREFVRTIVMPEDTSDDSSSSSEQIYYPPKTAAYSVAKRMSMSAIAARRASSAAYSADARPSISADVAAFLMAKRMSKAFFRRGTNTPINNKNDDAEDVQKNNTDSRSNQIAENTIVRSVDVRNDPSCQLKNETIQLKRASPLSSETTSTRSSTSTSRITDLEESNRRRSASPYIPATVVGFHLKSKTARSGSPYTSLQNDGPCTQEQNKGLPTAQISEIPSKNPSPPKRKRPPLKPTENHPLKFTKNVASKQTAPTQQSENAPAPQSENGCVPKRREGLPPKYGKRLVASRSESLPQEENAYTPDRLPLTSSEIAYRSHSPTPLHTVEEED